MGQTSYEIALEPTDDNYNRCDGCLEECRPKQLKELFDGGQFCNVCAEELEIKFYDLCAENKMKQRRAA